LAAEIPEAMPLPGHCGLLRRANASSFSSQRSLQGPIKPGKCEEENDDQDNDRADDLTTRKFHGQGDIITQKEMTIYRAFFLIIFAAAFAAGQITQRNVLSGHFTVDDIRRDLVSHDKWQPYPRSGAEWRTRLPQSVVGEVIKRGEQLLGKEVPSVPATLFLEYVRNGNRSKYEAKTFARRNQLMDLVLAEAVEDKGRFTDAIVNYVWAICEETYWGVPAHVGVQRAKAGLPDVEDPTVDLFGAETAATLALTDYLVGAKLEKVSPLIRKRIYREAVNKILEPITHSDRYNWLDPTKQVNNWNPWIISNVTITELLLETEEAKRAANVYRYMKLLDIYINGLGEDGGCDEGPSYWFAAGGSVFDTLETLKSATGGRVDVYKEPIVRKMASYVYKMYIADSYFVNFADADPTVMADGVMLYRFGKALGDDTLTQFGTYMYAREQRPLGEGFQKPRRLSNLLELNEMPAGGVSYIPPDDVWLSDIQVMTARTKRGLFLATHAGHNGESHNHNDVGDLIVYLGNEPVIIDAGRGNYTATTFSSHRYDLWFTQSQYHNLPIVNGFGQSAGRQFAARSVEQTRGDDPSLSMDIGSAFPKEAGIESWKRKVTLNRRSDEVLISDQYSLAKAPASLQQIFMTICDVDTSEPGRINLTTQTGKVVYINYDRSLWTVTIDKPSTEGPEYSSFATKWGGRQIKRIILTANSPVARNTLHYSLKVG